MGPGVPSRVSEEQDPYWAELAADSNRRFGEPLPSTDPRLVAAQAAARERLANPQPMDPRFGGTLVEEGENAAPPEGEPAPQAAEQPASESTVAPTDNSVVQSARRLTAEISDLANKSTPRRAVWVSAESLQHPPVAAKIKAMERGQRGSVFKVLRNADGKGGVLISSAETQRLFIHRKRTGESLEKIFGELTGAAVVTDTKPETANPVVVQRKDKNGQVVQETVVDGDKPQDVATAQRELSEDIDTPFGAFVNDYNRLLDRVLAAEKNSDREPITPEQQALLDAGRYEEFSRSRGYTEEEISDFNELVRLESFAGEPDATTTYPRGSPNEGQEAQFATAESVYNAMRATGAPAYVRPPSKRNVRTVTAQQAVAERAAEAAQEQQHPWMGITKVDEMRDFLASDPPFLGDQNTWSDQEAEAYEDEGILFLAWLDGKLPGYKKPSSHVRNAYKAWREQKFAERPVSDIDFGYSAPVDDLPLNEVTSSFSRDEKQTIRDVVQQLMLWDTDEATRLKAIEQLATNARVYGPVFEADQAGAEPRQLAIVALHAISGTDAVKSFIESAVEPTAESAAGSVAPGELTERETSQSVLLGQHSVVDGVRMRRSKADMRRGKLQESEAKPWAEEQAAELAARMWKKVDKTMDYFVYYIDKNNYRQFGYDSMPAGGAGYYVTATPTFNSETYYSTLLGRELGLTQLINIMLMRARHHWKSVLPPSVKSHPRFKYGIEAVDGKGKKTTLSTADIVNLGYIYDPGLRAIRDKSRAKGNLYAFLTGVSLIQTSSADLKLSIESTVREQRMESGGQLALIARELRGMKIPGNLVLEHRKNGRAMTLAHAIADAMFTKEELAKVADEARAKLDPKLASEKAFALVESAKLQYIKKHFQERYAQAVKQTEALLEAGTATPRRDRQATMRTAALAAQIDELQAKIDKLLRLQALARKRSNVVNVFGDITDQLTGMRARLAVLERSEQAPGFELREEAATLSQLAREVAQYGFEADVESMLNISDADEAGGANIDNPENQTAGYQMTETEEAQNRRSTSGETFATQPGERRNIGGTAIGTYAAGRAPTTLGNNPTVAPTASPTGELNITVALPEQEQYVDADGRVQVRATGRTVQRTLPAREAAGGIPTPEPGKGVSETSPLPPAPETLPPTNAPVTERTVYAPPQYVDGVGVRFNDGRRGKVARKLAVALRKLLSLSSQLIVVDNTEAALDMALRHRVFDMAELSEYARPRRAVGTVFRRPGVSIIYMNPAANDAMFLKSLAHEIGHVFYYEMWSKVNWTTRLRVEREYEAWLETDAGKHVVGLRPKYNIDEWIADSVAAWAVSNQKPKTAVERFFHELGVALKRIHDYMVEHYGGLNETVEEFIHEAIAASRGDDAAGAHSTSFESIGAADDEAFSMDVPPGEQPSHIRRAWAHVRGLVRRYPTVEKFLDFSVAAMKGAHEVFTSRVFSRVKRMNIANFDKIMDWFYHGVGADLAGKDASTYFSDMDGWLQRFNTKYRDIMEGLDERARNTILVEALNERAIDPNFEYAQELTRLRELYLEMGQYMRGAGLPVMLRDFYFTHVYDKAALAEPGAAQEILDELNLRNVEAAPGQPYTLEQVQQIITDMSDDNFTGDIDPEHQAQQANYSAPFAQALRMRTLPEPFRAAIRSILDVDGRPKYMSKSLDNVFGTYARESVRRAEWNRRGGDPNFLQRLQEWEALTDAERETTEKPRFRALGRLEDLVRTSGATTDQQKFMYDVVSAMLGEYGRIQSPALKKLTNAMMLYQNMRTLLYVTFASFPDLANIFIRTGEFKDTFRVIRQSAKAAIKGDLNGMLRMYGHAADTVDSMLARDIVNFREWDSDIWKWNERFFKAVQLQRWTNFIRGLGARVSEDYVQRHAELAAGGDPDSQRRLDELGISVDDVREWADPEGNARGSFFANPQNASPAVRRVTIAVQRMINDMVIHPTPPEKTLWGNSEQMKLLWHLKSFMYGFSTRVLGRAWHEMSRDGATNAQRAMAVGGLMLLLPLAAVGLLVRDLLQYWAWGKESYTPYDDPLAYLGQLAVRSGVTGFGQLAIDVAMASGRGRAPLLALSGPTVTQFNDFLEYPLYKTVPGAVPVLSSMPGARVYVADWLGGPAVE